MSISDVIRAHDKPFKWGENDCCSLMADAIKEVQNIDVLEDYPEYDSREGAAQVLREFGKGTLLATVIAKLGDPIPVAQARPGDIIMMDDRRIGVCCGRFTAMLQDEGIISIRTLACARAFKNRKARG